MGVFQGLQTDKRTWNKNKLGGGKIEMALIRGET